MIVSLIFAGGQSRRMGTDKALLEVDGVPLLQKVHQVAQVCTDRVYIVATPRPGFPADWHYLTESSPGQGPLLAFQDSLAQISADWVLLLACDLPYLEVSAVQRWCAELEQVPAAAIAYLAPHPKGWESLCGFYRPRCLPSLRQWIGLGHRSFQAWLASEVVVPMRETDRRLFVNWNYPHDREEILSSGLP